jgi:hypothetical protein
VRAPIRSLAETPSLYPRLVAVVALLVLAADEAGYNPTAWYPVALLLVGLLVATLLALGLPPRPSRPVLLALILLAAYTAWAYASILWAADQGAALTGASRATLYLLLFTLFAAWPGGARDGRVLCGLLGLGLALIGLVELIRLDRSSDPISFFIEGRLVEPAGYVNANVALWTTGLIACLALGAGRDVPVALRAAAFGGAGVLASLALLGQSRGWLLALPAALVALILLAPGRLRALAAILSVAGVTAIVSGRLFAVHDDFAPRRVDELVSDALAATLTSALILAILGAAAALVDRRVAPRGGPRARVGRTGLAVGAGAALALLVAAFALADGPARLSDAWDEFKEGGQPSAGSSRFASVGTYRYDFWRVAWELFEENPVAGIGADNFQDEYLRRSRGFEQPQFAHSLELGVLSQTGIVGAALLFGALACALTGAALRRRDGGTAFAWVSAGALAVFIYWLFHASVDWLWEFPALAGSALAALGLACADPPQALAPRRTGARAPTVPVAAALLLLVPLLAAPWIAELETKRAVDGWREDPQAALSSLDRAESLNPLSTRPLLVRAAIELERSRLPAAEAAFREVLEEEPDNAYALLQLGAIAGERGRSSEAVRLLERARALRPRDEITADVLAALRRGERVRVSAVNARIVERARARLQRQP